ncbi:MAG: hypothetical protein ACRDTA_11055 [Pseudonocardiaceae bacterium]
MIADQSTRLPPGYRPRRAPQPPQIDPGDRPLPEEIECQRQATRRRCNRFIRSR